MRTTRLLSTIATAAVVTVLVATTADATLVNPPNYRDAFDDSVCGISSHVVIIASNPIIETGRVTQTSDPVTIDSGHLVVHFTNVANGHWMEDDFSGPAMVISCVANADGTLSKRVVFTGTKRKFSAWDGTVVADRGRLAVDYVIQDDEVLSRTTVSQVGDFPIASGAVGFCEFAAAHLS